MTIRQPLRKIALSLTAAVLAGGSASAVEVPLAFLSTNLPPLDVHGFVSQGFLYSSDYNYLAESKGGSLEFTEIGLNVSCDPFPRTRIAAQAFAFEVGQAGNCKTLSRLCLAGIHI
jgi:hypothetical protein